MSHYFYCIILLFILLLKRGSHGLFPKTIKQRATHQASTMVDLAKLVEKEASVPTSQEAREEFLANALEDIHQTFQDSTSENFSNEDNTFGSSHCEPPSYKRDYQKPCPEGFTQPTWAKGACYYAGPLKHHGFALIDFALLNTEEKMLWEKKNCLFFPRLMTHTRIKEINHFSPFSNAEQIQKAPGISGQHKIRQALEIRDYSAKLYKTPQGPISSNTGEIITE